SRPPPTPPPDAFRAPGCRAFARLKRFDSVIKPDGPPASGRGGSRGALSRLERRARKPTPPGGIMAGISRRVLLGVPLAAGLPADAARAWAGGDDGVTIGWPSDVPSWDPNRRFVPDAQPIFKMVYDQPLDQDPRLNLVPSLIA